MRALIAVTSFQLTIFSLNLPHYLLVSGRLLLPLLSHYLLTWRPLSPCRSLRPVIDVSLAQGKELRSVTFSRNLQEHAFMLNMEATVCAF
ncbi:hypothetical protein DEU56DRAFT_240849 [Suillus clintonianus]|uniref:uncharacterized protein n=1 Tax=Suillus clintonianus TaxID=1904413 RepID=UPI001B861800|nr:uncharacterized protein DEU56DRAFT_240849 [Suillus clintonianus]KAG2110798.1 hypothetical protein DEU56DRAFT_240849 [Suillus clintonianus]